MAEADQPIDSTGETAGVPVRPPVLYVGMLGLGFALDWLWPAALLPTVVQAALGAGLIGAGAGLMAAAMRRFRAAGTSVQTVRPSRALVTDGPYRVSRNPIYLGLAAIAAGIGVAADNPWIIALLAPLLGLVTVLVIGREERYLERRFGDDYRRYKAAVRRWL